MIPHKYHALGRRTTRTADRVGNHTREQNHARARGRRRARRNDTHGDRAPHPRPLGSPPSIRRRSDQARRTSSPRSSGVVGGHVFPWGPRKAPQMLTSSPRWFLLVRFAGSLLHHAVCHPAVYHTAATTLLMRREAANSSLLSNKIVVQLLSRESKRGGFPPCTCLLPGYSAVRSNWGLLNSADVPFATVVVE